MRRLSGLPAAGLALAADAAGGLGRVAAKATAVARAPAASNTRPRHREEFKRVGIGAVLYTHPTLPDDLPV